MLQKNMIDSHFHLYHMKNRNMDENIIQNCFDEGLAYALDIGINSDNFESRIEAASKFRQLYTAHGYYPSQCSSENLETELDYLESCLKKDEKAIAVGEMGLDFFHSYGTPELQTELAKREIEIANRLSLPIIIHSREAEAETLALLEENPSEAGGIIHCFSYKSETAAKFIEMGYYISFAGNLTYKKAELIQEAAKSVPLNRLLLETDAPYLSPQKVRSKKNHPGYIGYTYEFAAELRQITLEQLIEAVKENFEELFNINC